MKLLVSNFYISSNFSTLTQAHLDLQMEPSCFDLTTQPLFNDSPVLFLETMDKIYAHPSEQIEQTEHTTPTEVNTPPGTTHEVPHPPKKSYEMIKDQYCTFS